MCGPSLPLLGKIIVEIFETRIPVEDGSTDDEIKFRLEDTFQLQKSLNRFWSFLAIWSSMDINDRAA
jgi:hypothetical protein